MPRKESAENETEYYLEKRKIKKHGGRSSGQHGGTQPTFGNTVGACLANTVEGLTGMRTNDLQDHITTIDAFCDRRRLLSHMLKGAALGNHIKLVTLEGEAHKRMPCSSEIDTLHLNQGVNSYLKYKKQYSTKLMCLHIWNETVKLNYL